MSRYGVAFNYCSSGEIACTSRLPTGACLRMLHSGTSRSVLSRMASGKIVVLELHIPHLQPPLGKPCPLPTRPLYPQYGNNFSPSSTTRLLIMSSTIWKHAKSPIDLCMIRLNVHLGRISSGMKVISTTVEMARSAVPPRHAAH